MDIPHPAITPETLAKMQLRVSGCPKCGGTGFYTAGPPVTHETDTPEEIARAWRHAKHPCPDCLEPDVPLLLTLAAEGIRLRDLVRYRRADFYMEGVLGEAEDLELAKDGAAVSRLGSYDELRQQLGQYKRDLARERRSWHDEGENAYYYNICATCKLEFVGRKGRLECRSCAR